MRSVYVLHFTYIRMDLEAEALQTATSSEPVCPSIIGVI